MGVEVSRRDLVTGAGLSLAALPALAQQPAASPPPAATDPPAAVDAAQMPALKPPNWNRVRSQWALAWDEVDLSAMLIASNPKPVREAIERHRKQLDARPITYLEANNKRLQNAARAAAGAYFAAPYEDVALCESTTAGIGILYSGLGLKYGDEVLTTVHDYYVTHESLRLAALRSGASVKKIRLHEGARSATPSDMVQRITAAITPKTRVLALTWVHSSTGLKMPIRQIADALKPINAARPPAEKVLFCVDGVHGFGIEATTLPDLGCDFLVASCHKWLFGPRGTAVVFGTPQGWARVTPNIPSFLASNAYSAWIGGYDPGPTTGARMTPGGFKAFEHVWALPEAFQFHQTLGKTHVRNRTHELAGRLKAGLSAMPHVTLITPPDPNLSAGIVAFDVAGRSADSAVDALRRWRVIGSAAPYATPHVRLTPSIRNTPEDIDFALKAVAALA